MNISMAGDVREIFRLTIQRLMLWNLMEKLQLEREAPFTKSKNKKRFNFSMKWMNPGQSVECNLLQQTKLNSRMDGTEKKEK